MAARKKKHLVIVESPRKAQTINKYLGPDFEVAASVGHIRDLPKNTRGGLGIDIEKGWVPTYKILEKSKEVVAGLKKKAAASDTVYLAPDPDREGEAIAWHLKEALGLADERVRRVTFNEITKRAVQEAFQNPRNIDMDLVAAQEARRMLDRVVGYPLSALLRNKVARGLSAGRVQSVAVRLIVEREKEIKAFVPEEYWRIMALLAPAGTVKLKTAVSKDKPTKTRGKKASAEAPPPPEDAVSKTRPAKSKDDEAEETGAEAPPAIEVPDGAFLAELVEWEGKKFQADNGETCRTIVSSLEGAAYKVAKIEQKDQSQKPQPPFTTSTMQQQASIRLRMSAKQTMAMAQRLYQGKDLGNEGSVGLITYMRTDSTRVSNDALKMCRDHILKDYGQKYLPEKPNSYASGKSAQEAHEAVRPTDVTYTPDRVAKYLDKDELRLYTLIYNRFVASQMTPAVFAVTTVDVKAGEANFRAKGRILKFDGFRRVMAPAGKQEDALLPPLHENQILDLLQPLDPTQHFTKPPPRYNVASLVDSLEKEGIGRPSTYATIIDTIQKRGYVRWEERRFYATELGITVTDLLVKHFEKEMDLKFTSHMEDELDLIEHKKVQRNDVLNEFYGPFQQALESAKTEMQAVKGVETGENCPKCQKPLVRRFSSKNGSSFMSCSGYPECKFTKPIGEDGQREAPVATDFKCPTCGKGMVKRMGKRGEFLGCEGYPECKTTMNFDAQGNPVLASQPTEHVCEKCNAPMVIREGRRGPFLGCSAYPKCKNTKELDAQGNPVQPIDTGIVCEKCGSPMAVRRGPRGPFLGCTGYPKCRSSKPVPAELKEKLKEMMPPKKQAPAVEVSEVCPDCGAPMKLREGRRSSWFLGCSKYPKCKGKRDASPEILEQVGAT